MAELAGLPSPRMDWHSSDPPQTFRKFRATCELYFSGPLKDKSEEEKISYLLIWTGDEGIELASTWSLTADQKKKLSTYWDKFEDYVAPKSNFRLARFKLRTIKQGKDETVDSFLKQVRVLVSECKFTNTEEHIIDALIFGSNNSRVQSKLLEQDATLTLDKAIDIARTQEATSHQLHDIRGTTTNEVHNLKHTPKPASRPTCGNCGTVHDLSNKTLCPAHGTKCKACGKANHWKQVCRSSKANKSQHKPRKGPNKGRPRQAVHSIGKQEKPTTPDVSQLYFDTIQVNGMMEKRQATLELQVNIDEQATPIHCKVDTGAEGNVIPVNTYKQLFPSAPCDSVGTPLGLKPSTTAITAFGGHNIPHFGTCMLNLTYNGRSNSYPFHVVNSGGPTILGLPTCIDMNLVTLNYTITQNESSPMAGITSTPAGNPEAKKQLIQQHTDCFEGIGCFHGEFHITLDPTVPPVIHPPRRVPAALSEPLKKELDSLVAQGIISKVDEPTDWVNSLVCVTKSNGSLRLCLDPKDLNKAIKRPHHCTPTLDEVLPKLNGAKYFSIVDARSGYWNIQLDHESSLYTTFNSPHGRYRFLRLPFGLICAQDIFQKKVDETFGDLPGVTGIADDIIVYGYEDDGSDHDKNLQAVMSRARETGLRFNADKCKIRCTELPFFGHIISANGLRPDPRKVEAIANMDPSTCLADLQTFLGMTQFLSRFVPNLASVSATLWDLTKKSSDFQWGPEHESAAQQIKGQVASPNSLQYFDSSKPVTIQVDASQRGLGAALIQDKGPVEYRSKLLTETETRYSNIEREMLAVVHGLEKFHYYAYGRHVVVESDHKPLEAIFKKPLSNAPPRIARMLLRIQKYDVEITYVPGKNIPLADALSRLSPCVGETIADIDIQVHELHLHLNANPTRIAEIRNETVKDTNLNSLLAVISHGWPDKRAECPSHLHTYWNYRDELTVADGLILKGTRIIIPKSLQPAVLEQLHYGHQGAEKCKLRAKGSVFWANINADIEQMVKGCGPCQRHQNMNMREPLIPHDVPQRPWHTLGSDLFFWNNSAYLIVCDYFSKFPLIRKLNNIQSITTIAHLKSMFEEHGIPNKLITGNDTQFTSTAFKDFSRQYGFVHVTTSPYYPQANGFIERNVQTVKNLLQKCKESGADPHLAMLCLRTTPIDHGLPSPAELLNSRVYQSNLPAITKPSLAPIADGDVNVKLQSKQDQQKSYYDKTSKPLPPLYPQDPVRVFDHRSKTWKPGIVRDGSRSPRSFMVDMTDGTTLLRNRRHMRSTGETNILPDNGQSPTVNVESSSPVDNASPPVSSPPQSPAPKPEEPPSPTLRRSSRRSKPPEKLNLALNLCPRQLKL